jgi:MraZ protein
MFVGHWEHTIDEKGRLIIPVRYRPLMEGGSYITSGFDQNLMVMTSATFDKIQEQISEMSVTDPLTRQLRRLIFGNAEPLELDKAGRILIPAYLRDLAQLNSEAIIAGEYDYFEIWAPPLWKNQNDLLKDEANSQRYAVFHLSLR